MRFHFLSSQAETAQEARQLLIDRYGQSDPKECDVAVSIGGDGQLLDSLVAVGSDKPVFGLNRGTIGFLLNEYRLEGLIERVSSARRVTIHPLRMRATGVDGQVKEALAFNEVALFRETSQAAHIAIDVDGVRRMERLICDGVLLATPAGSTAYNLSAHGTIIPLRSRLMGLTPISAFRPRRWRGALLPDNAEVTFDVLDPMKRPVAATADSTEFRDCAQVSVTMDFDKSYHLLFDADQALEERILQEQFEG